MQDKFTTIYNVLTMIETKGEQTKMMADCLRFIEQCIYECEQEILQQEKADNSEA